MGVLTAKHEVNYAPKGIAVVSASIVNNEFYGCSDYGVGRISLRNRASLQVSIMGIMTAITSPTIVITTKTNTTGTSTAPIARAGGKSLRRFALFFPKKTTNHNDVDSRRPLTENVVSSLDLESRFYAVLSKAASSGLASNPRQSKSRGTETAKRPRQCSNKQKGSKWRSYAWQEHNERIHRQK